MDSLSDLEALLGDEGPDGQAEGAIVENLGRVRGSDGLSDAGSAAGAEEEDSEEAAPVNKTKAGNRTVVRKKKKKKKKRSKRNATIVEEEAQGDGLLEERTDALGALKEGRDAEQRI